VSSNILSFFVEWLTTKTGSSASDSNTSLKYDLPCLVGEVGSLEKACGCFSLSLSGSSVLSVDPLETGFFSSCSSLLLSDLIDSAPFSGPNICTLLLSLSTM